MTGRSALLRKEMLFPAMMTVLPIAAAGVALFGCWVRPWRGLDPLLIAFQVVGTALTAYAIVAQRRALNVKGIRALVREWAQRLRPPVTHDATGALTGVGATLTAGSLGVRNTGVPVGEQIARLWEALDQQNNVIQQVRAQVEKLQARADFERAEVQRQLQELERRMAEAVTAGPSIPLAGLSLLILSAAFQALRAGQMCAGG